jgi:hypothetical protein
MRLRRASLQQDLRVGFLDRLEAAGRLDRAAVVIRVVALDEAAVGVAELLV